MLIIKCMALFLAVSNLLNPPAQGIKDFQFINHESPYTLEQQVMKRMNHHRHVDLTIENLTYLNIWAEPQFWQSTGLYALPGNQITVWVPQGIPPTEVQIGCHEDTLTTFSLSERLRPDQMVVRKTLKPGMNQLTNTQGGLIYFASVWENNQTADFIIQNAVNAPYFVLGKHTLKDWERMKSSDIPYIELESNRLIVTLSTSDIQTLEDPIPLIKKWDEMVEKVEELQGLKTEGALPSLVPKVKWRYVDDVQISYGSMYAGYPIMMYDPIDVALLTSVEGFTQEGWGFWHELAHNYQQPNWEIPSIVEVTNNISSLYVQEHFGNPSQLSQDNDGYGKSSFQMALAYLAKPSSEKNYHDDDQLSVFTRLVMFWQLKEAYGWEFYQKLFTAFRENANSITTSTDQSKIDALVVQASLVSGENLLPFFNDWGYGYSDVAIQEILSLGLTPPKEDLILLIKP